MTALTTGHSAPQGGGASSRSSPSGSNEKLGTTAAVPKSDVAYEEAWPQSQDHTHRKLKPRHIQLIGIGGTIGTALFVAIGKGLLRGGPGSLFIAFSLWSFVILCVSNCLAEMVCYLPISSPFIRFAGRYVDHAFGVATGWNFFIFEAALVPFEIVACNVILHFWSQTEDLHPGIIITIVLVVYALNNLFAVKWYGETEFWMALGKMILIIALICFTFITMLGANPIKDRFGFRYWQEPGPFAEFYAEGNLGRFMGFMACLIQASFTIAGPDYVSMAAGEAENPRYVLPRAFKAVFYRLTTFFVLGSLCVGILVPYDDKELKDAFENSKPGAAASPYVIAMNRLKVPVLPHIVNALVLTSALSAGNSYVFCASRSLFGLALEGKAPKIFTKTNRQGVPVYAVGIVLLIALLAFLQVSNSSAIVLQWFVSLVTASQLINYAICSFTFIKFYNAMKAQGISRDALPFKGFWQPYCAYFACTCTTVMCVVGGYTVFLPGKWDVPTFLFSYMMVFLVPVIFISWKLIKGTRWQRAHEVDLIKDKDEVDEYERNYVPMPPKSTFSKYFNKVFE